MGTNKLRHLAQAGGGGLLLISAVVKGLKALKPHCPHRLMFAAISVACAVSGSILVADTIKAKLEKDDAE